MKMDLKRRSRRTDAVVLILGALLVAVAGLLFGWRAAVLAAMAALAAGVFLVYLVTSARTALAGELRAEMRSHLAQIEAFQALAAYGGRDELLPVLTGWTLAADNLVHVLQTVRERRPETIVELGSGASTMILAAELRKSGRGRIVSLEHELPFAEATRRRLAAAGLDRIATVVDAPLEPYNHPDGADTGWYAQSAVSSLPDSIDLLIVDGPPRRTGPWARYPALPELVAKLAPDAVVLLDDARRQEEEKILNRWKREYADFEGEVLRTSAGLAVLYRRRHPH